jgi:hypothetical protein
MWATDSNGQFTDFWSLSSDQYTPAGCGDAVVDQWQLCGLAVATNVNDQQYTLNEGLTFAGLNGFTDNNEVGQSVDGNLYVLPGNGACGPDYLLCPDRIPAGTIITPSN